MENRKIVERDGMDQISNLSDDVLVIILSLVPTEQAVTTSFLSKRWKFLWNLLPELDFDYVSFCKSFGIVFEGNKKERFRGFLEFVDYVFTHHQVEHLQRLRFAFDIDRRKNYATDKNYASEVRRLVRVAMRRNCLTLELQFSNPATVSYPTYHGMRSLPPCISFPHRSFKYEGASCYLSINNAENLIEVEIQMVFNKPNEHMFLFKLLNNLSNVEVLKLGFRYLEVLDTNGGRSMLTPLCNLKHLSLKLLRLEREVLTFMCLLRNSPYLETLSIDLHSGNEDLEDMLLSVYSDGICTVMEPLLLPSDCVMHLTKIEIKNFQGSKVEMEFVKIMLQSSLCLKEMVICISSRYEYLKQRLKQLGEFLHKKKNAAVENILACTCASPNAQILIK
ncbi:hypothetical protein C5167_017846 [Papaver somniferum]|uniref:F-box domain-containing protein n=1 Tax=Papaver somniferum TaxID=3469 RepID=A0A4Y7INN0_PAPSO|nr:F-box/LRR-repeat protein At3g26922-like [Papaver somniferum]RZC49420.1 hypothetical protein C5167_017846 [Papaver somniferum]